MINTFREINMQIVTQIKLTGFYFGSLPGESSSYNFTIANIYIYTLHLLYIYIQTFLKISFVSFSLNKKERHSPQILGRCRHPAINEGEGVSHFLHPDIYIHIYMLIHIYIQIFR